MKDYIKALKEIENEDETFELTLSKKEVLDLIKEIKRLNNIINDLLNRQNEALKYINNFLSMDDRYKHGNGNEELELVRRKLNDRVK